MSKKTQNDIQRINQALSAAISSINLAKSLLKDIDGTSSRIDTREIDGIVGVFDGKDLVTESGERLEVPINYASKSKIVFGDTLKMVEDDGKKLFKQIERVKRLTKTGIISKQGGEMVVVTGDGTYKILQVAVEFYKLTESGQVQVLVPENNIHAPFATIDKNLDDRAQLDKGEIENRAQLDKGKVEVKQEKQVVAKKAVEKKIEVKEQVEEKTVERLKYSSSTLATPEKVETKTSTIKPAPRKTSISAIVDKEKPRTSKLVNDENSISRIIGDDDLR